MILSRMCCRRSPHARPDAVAGWARRRARTGALHRAALASARRDAGALHRAALASARHDAGALPSITGAVASARRDAGALPSVTGAVAGARRDAGALPSITGAVAGARRDAGALPSITGAAASARRDAGALPAARAPIVLGTCETPGGMQGAFGWSRRRAAQASWAGFPWPVLAPAGCRALDENYFFASTQKHQDACRCNGIRKECSFNNAQRCMEALAWSCVCSSAHTGGGRADMRDMFCLIY